MTGSGRKRALSRTTITDDTSQPKLNNKEKRERLVPVLIDLQRDLDKDVSLESLSTRFGTSPFHFHKLFSQSIGETPKKHVNRLRLEKAAYLLAITDDPVFEIGLSVGFKNAETFSRNFKRNLNRSPSNYRRRAKAAQAERLEHHDFHHSDSYMLSQGRFESIPSTPLLAIRHMGDYGDLNESFGDDDNLWNALISWAHDAEIQISPVLVGLFYDDPTVTPEPLQRCDVCIPADRMVEGTDSVRCIQSDGGLYAVAEYVGRISTILHAFRGLADDVRRSERYTFRDGAAVEFLRTPNVGGEAGVHHIDVCFPVKER